MAAMKKAAGKRRSPVAKKKKGAAARKPSAAKKKRKAVRKRSAAKTKKRKAAGKRSAAKKSVRLASTSAPSSTRRTAEEMAASQREISVSEFFTKNRHLLGFDNPRKALLTAVREGVDNALDACE